MTTNCQLMWLNLHFERIKFHQTNKASNSSNNATYMGYAHSNLILVPSNTDLNSNLHNR